MSTLRMRERGTTQPFLQQIGSFTYRNRRNGWTTEGGPFTATLASGVVEKCFDELHGRPPYNTGGPFIKIEYLYTNAPCATGSIKPAQGLTTPPANYPYPSKPDDIWVADYEGAFYPTNLPSVVSIAEKSISSHDDYRAGVNPNDLSSLGSRGYNKLRPKVEVAGLGQAIAEARDVPSMLKTSAKGFHEAWKSVGGRADGNLMSPKGAAEHFLNHQFGWKPFLKDLNDTYSLVSNYVSHLDKAMRLNDKWQRRTFREAVDQSHSKIFSETKERSSPTFKSYLAPGFTSQLQTTQLIVSLVTETEVWYEGQFKTYDPAFDMSREMDPNVRAGRQFLSLGGMNINPTLLYKVTPWTWLIDWFANVGDNVQIAQDLATNSVVAKYMYLMRRTSKRYEYSIAQQWNGGSVSGVAYDGITIKRRATAASPFSFVLAPGGLSGTQIAILGALGLTRL